MTMIKWVAALLSGFGLSASKRRSSVWSGGASGTLEIQVLESRQVMSAANATSALNELTTAGEANSSPTSSASGGVTFASGATAIPRVAVTQTEDLFDEGAGAVWGGLTENLPGGANWLLTLPRGNPGTTGPGLADFPPAGWGGTLCGDMTTGGITGITGGGVTGGGSGNGSLSKVEILAIDNEALEGPYEISRRDEAIFRLRRIGGDLLRSLPVRVELWGDATPGRDYRITDMNREMIPPDPYSPGTPSVTITIPYGKDIVDFKMLTCMDGEFEDNEAVLPTVVRVAGGQYEPGVVTVARATIYDKTADIDIASAENREKLLSDTAEDDPGATIFVDSDFDAGKPQHDKEFYKWNAGGFAEAENDVLNMTVTSHVLPDNDSAAKGLPRSFSFNFDILRVRLFEPDISKGIKNLIWRPITYETTFKIKQGETLNFRVEGLSAGKGSIGLVWKDATGVQRDIVFDSVKYTSWDVDIDIDSNNNNGLGDPERGDWEEYIEDSKYGIGKILYLNQQVSQPGQQYQFTPVKFLAQNVDPNVGAKFVWNEYQGDSGYVRIWTAPTTVAGGLKMKQVEDGGHLITQGRVYTGEELAKISGLWMQAVVAQSQHNTMAGVALKRPDDRLKMELVRRDNPSTAWKTLRSDEVKYLVCDSSDRFYPNLQFDHPERYWTSQSAHTGVVLRDSLVSEGVYSLADMPEYGQQRLSEKQMLDMGILPSTVKLIMDSQQGDGMKCVLYRDYLNEDGKAFVLSFAGTEMEFQDVLTDILQGIGLEGSDFADFLGAESQYGPAMEIGYWLAKFATENGFSLRMTGHSLGGGLASAASIAANEFRIPANTFNAAGLHRSTLTMRDRWGNFVAGVPAYKEAFRQFDRERSGEGLITAFSMEYDPLTLFQRYMPPVRYIGSVPVSVGKQVTLDGPQTAVFTQGVIRLRADLQNMPAQPWYLPYSIWLNRFTVWTALVIKNNWDTLSTMMHHHKIKTCQYGLMVEQKSAPARARKFDIFGYKDPDQ